MNFCYGPYNTYDWVVLSYQLPFGYGHETILEIADFIISHENFKLDKVQKTDILHHPYIIVNDIYNNSIKTSKILKNECAEITITGYVKGFCFPFFRNSLLQMAFVNQTDILNFRIPKTVFQDNKLEKYTRFANKICNDLLEKYSNTTSNKVDNNKLLKEGKDKILCHDLEKAIEIFSTIIENDSAFEQAYFYRAIAYELSSTFDNVILDYQKLLELNPFSEDANYNLGLLYEKLENYTKALKYIKLSEQSAIKNNNETSSIKCQKKIIEIENKLNAETSN